MTYFLAGISLFSFLISSWSLKLGKLSRYFTFALVFVFLAYVAISFSGSSVDLIKIRNVNLWVLLVIEGILFWLFTQNSKSSIVPNYSLPFVTSLLFAFVFQVLTKENVGIIISSTIVLQALLSGKLKDWDYLIRKAIIALVISIFLILTYYIQGGFTLPLVVFIYWYVSELIPLGIEEKNEDNLIQPLANRVLLISLLLTGTRLDFNTPVLISTAGFISVAGSLSVYFSKGVKSVWKNFRRASEAMIIIIFLSYNNQINESLLLAILTLSFYSFIPLLILAKPENILFKILRPICILGLIGLLGGGLKSIIFEGLLYSKLEGIGLIFLPLIGFYWLIVYSFWLRLKKAPQIESKIDHLTLLTSASAIIMSVIISF